jgi:hypothetical protein
VDAIYPDLWPYQGGTPDDNDGQWYLYADYWQANAGSGQGKIEQGMPRCCIPRHNGSKPPWSIATAAVLTHGTTVPLYNGGVNIGLDDGHAEHTTLENLWWYYWNLNEVPASRPIH